MSEPWIATGEWRKLERGGYGYESAVPVRLIRRTAKRLLVEAPLIRGGYKRVWITPERYIPSGGVKADE